MNAEQIVLTYSDMVYGIAFRYMGNRAEAEDVYQETFLTYFKKEREFKSEEHRKAWLIRVTINNAKTLLMSRKYPDEIDESIADNDEPIRKEDAMDLKDAIEKLKPEYKEAITLFYINDLPVREIAAVLGVTENTVKLRLTRARQKLKEFLV